MSVKGKVLSAMQTWDVDRLRSELALYIDQDSEEGLKEQFSDVLDSDTWTDDEMREHLEDMGYDLTDDAGKFSSLVMSELAVNEGYKWDEKEEVWR